MSRPVLLYICFLFGCTPCVSTVAIVYIPASMQNYYTKKICFIFCGQRLFYADSLSDEGHAHATALCSVRALTQARLTPQCHAFI